MHKHYKKVTHKHKNKQNQTFSQYEYMKNWYLKIIFRLQKWWWLAVWEISILGIELIISLKWFQKAKENTVQWKFPFWKAKIKKTYQVESWDAHSKPQVKLKKIFIALDDWFSDLQAMLMIHPHSSIYKYFGLFVYSFVVKIIKYQPTEYITSRRSPFYSFMNKTAMSGIWQL